VRTTKGDAAFPAIACLPQRSALIRYRDKIPWCMFADDIVLHVRLEKVYFPMENGGETLWT